MDCTVLLLLPASHERTLFLSFHPPHPGPACTQGSASQADADEFLSLMQQVAVSSAFGAVQCSYGRCEELAPAQQAGAIGGGSHAEQRPDVLVLARFQEAAQLQQFLACPPVAALLEVRATWAGMASTTCLPA